MAVSHGALNSTWGQANNLLTGLAPGSGLGLTPGSGTSPSAAPARLSGPQAQTFEHLASGKQELRTGDKSPQNI